MAKIILFEHINFSGKSLVLDQSIQHLKRKGFENRVSSLIVIDGQWTLYRDVEFGGRPLWHVQHNGGPDEDGTYPQVQDWRGDNVQISSVQMGHHD
jgi:hypothetical protein